MKTERIRIVSADVLTADLARKTISLAYTLRAPVGDNHATVDLIIADPKTMAEALFEAARAKAALLAEVFGGKKTDPDSYQVADFRYTCERLAPLFARLAEAAADKPLEPAALARLETDGVHLLRADLDLDGKDDAARAHILRLRATAHLQTGDVDNARLMAQRALRLRPDDEACRDVLARCTPAP